MPAGRRYRWRRARVEVHAAQHPWTLTLIDAGEYGDPRYRANPLDRCCWCKTSLYARIRACTAEPIASGTNRDELDDFRPGLRAAAEQGVALCPRRRAPARAGR